MGSISEIFEQGCELALHPPFPEGGAVAFSVGSQQGKPRASTSQAEVGKCTQRVLTLQLSWQRITAGAACLETGTRTWSLTTDLHGVCSRLHEEFPPRLVHPREATDRIPDLPPLSGTHCVVLPRAWKLRRTRRGGDLDGGLAVPAVPTHSRRRGPCPRACSHTPPPHPTSGWASPGSPLL